MDHCEVFEEDLTKEKMTKIDSFIEETQQQVSEKYNIT